MRSNGTARPVILTTADHKRHHQCGYAGVDMYHRPPGKVHGSHFHQETAAPYPMGHGHVDQYAPQHREAQETGEPHTFGERTENQSRRNQGEHALEHYEQHIGDTGRRQRIQADAVQHHLVESPDAVFEETATFISGAEGKAVAEGHPQDADHPGYGQALHHQAQHIFLAHKAAVEQGDSGNRHHKHQKGCHNHPSRVA